MSRKSKAKGIAVFATGRPEWNKPVSHTATPWRRHDTEHDAIVASGDRLCIALVYAPNQQRPDAECAANLEFIVRACNAHDDLVAALQQAVDAAGYGKVLNKAGWVQACAAIAKAGAQ